MKKKVQLEIVTIKTLYKCFYGTTINIINPQYIL